MRKILLAIVYLLTPGCSMLPEMPQETLETAIVVQNLKCEFQAALFEVDPHNTWLKYWNVNFNLSLAVDEKGTINPNGTFTHPFVHPVLSIPFSGLYSREVTRTE